MQDIVGVAMIATPTIGGRFHVVLPYPRVKKREKLQYAYH